jgi:hypothetical protein
VYKEHPSLINEHDILQDVGKVTAKIAQEFAISEFEKYKVIQDKTFSGSQVSLGNPYITSNSKKIHTTETYPHADFKG